jgi:NAD(P)-dependent dehydrogenase (short-subunit alcohol dehydrogenase family)
VPVLREMIASPDGDDLMTDDWTEADIPDQTGRTALITGANSGIGWEAARALAQSGAHVVMACRNPAKAVDAEAAIADASPSGSTEMLLMDLADLDSVQDAAAKFLANHDRLDLLIDNAGVMATPEQRTTQGFEMQFGVNHLGHFALTAHVLDKLRATDSSRVVSISSNGHKPGRIDFDDPNSEKKYSPWGAYFQSKLANLLFTRELQRRLTAGDLDVVAVAAHPGGSRTNLGHESAGGILSALMAATRPVTDRLLAQSAAMGALPTLRAATDPDVVGDDYFGPSGFGEVKGHPVKVGRSSRASDDDAAGRLWELSESLTGVTYPI